jgi:murein DD-endopeptidase MepM/ murein hydrolase activator NlpD
MPRSVLTTGRRLFSRRAGVAVVVASLVVASASFGGVIGSDGSSGEHRDSRAAPEPVLDGTSVSPPRDGDAARKTRKDPQDGRGATPTVVEALAPGQAPTSGTRSDAGPPEHIRKENVRLRQELAHLKALEAERRRVARALNAAGVSGGLVGSGRLSWPLIGPLTSPFGQRWGRLHAGIDIAASAGTPIRAADSGTVVLAGWQGGYGLYTCVRHTASLSTCYAHQSRLGTTSGAPVRKGEVIGYVGNTGHSFGNHLHFETWVRGQPVDPMGFL